MSTNCLFNSIEQLCQSRSVFHSEADFQHSLAWMIHLQNPDFKIRCEYKPPKFNKSIFVDLWIEDLQGKKYAIELKYKTQKLIATVNNEDYHLRNHAAHDIGRYDYLKDLERVENITATHDNTSGYAIMLSNDSAYWKKPTITNTVDSSFLIHEGRDINGSLSWKSDAFNGTTSKREKPLKIQGAYHVQWENYSVINSSSYGEMRMLTLEVQ